MVLLLIGYVSAMKNPMAVYCERMGYEYTLEESPSGVTGICIMPDGTRCIAADFVRGECAEEYSYCAIKGWELKKGAGEAVCILPDGTEKWVTQLVKEDAQLGEFVEGKVYFPTCGNNICELSENSNNCPQDCAPDKTTTVHMLCGNNICDAGEDSVNCPNDCKPVQPAPQDVQKQDYESILLAIGVIILLVVAIYLLRKKGYKI